MADQNNENKMIEYFQNKTPEEFLKETLSFPGPSKEDFEVINKIREYRIPDSVINVLINVTLLKFDLKLSKPFMEKMAVEWSRKRIKTIEDAIELTKRDYIKYREWVKYEKIMVVELDDQPNQMNELERTKLKAIELVAKTSSMNDQDLGKFVRNMLLTD